VVQQGYGDMTREELRSEIIVICSREFEMENPDPDDDLREKYGFDSIDGIELLIQIEKMLQTELTQEEKKQSLNIRTINQVCDYIENIMKARKG
jgi:acyl carrier protein